MPEEAFGSVFQEEVVRRGFRWVLHFRWGTWDDDLNVGEVISDHLLVGSLHLISHDEVMPLRVVGLAVVPDQLDVVEDFLNSSVLSGLELVLHFLQVHGVLDN
jgi:hypothetical protein